MKNILDLIFRNTFLWFFFFASATYGWELMYENLSWMKEIGITFGSLAIISLVYSIVVAIKEKKNKKG